ncbi:MAG TPA: 4-vinyl reductase [archaeon]|nr:4-vinyl reductase [archaeon]
MFEFTKKLFLANQFTLQRGEIALLKQPVLIIPTTAMVGLAKIMTEKNLGHILYIMERDSIPPFVKELKNKHKAEHRELVILMKNLAETAGWGYIELIEYDRSKHHSLFRLQKSPISLALGKYDKAIDHVERGLIVGSLREIEQDYEIEGIETKCICKGDSYCEIIVKPLKDFSQEQLAEYGWQIR